MNVMLKAQIETIAMNASEEGQYVDIQDSIELEVFVFRGKNDEFHFQYDEAQKLLDDAQKIADELEIDVEDVILYQAQNW